MRLWFTYILTLLNFPVKSQTVLNLYYSLVYLCFYMRVKSIEHIVGWADRKKYWKSSRQKYFNKSVGNRPRIKLKDNEKGGLLESWMESVVGTGRDHNDVGVTNACIGYLPLLCEEAQTTVADRLSRSTCSSSGRYLPVPSMAVAATLCFTLSKSYSRLLPTLPYQPSYLPPYVRPEITTDSQLTTRSH